MAAFDESLLGPLIANVTGFLVGGGASLAEELCAVRAELHYCNDMLVVNTRYYNDRVQQQNFLWRLIKCEQREAELMRWQSEAMIVQVTLNSMQHQ
jgi:hypothetical protein